MRYRLRTLLIVLAVGAAMLAGLWWQFSNSETKTTRPALNGFDADDEVTIWQKDWEAIPPRPPGEI